jgi:hypothetical protein
MTAAADEKPDTSAIIVVAALHVARKVGLDLIYVGKVGTGWSRTVSSRIRKQLDIVVSPKSKLTKPIRAPKSTCRTQVRRRSRIPRHHGRGAAPRIVIQGPVEGMNPNCPICIGRAGCARKPSEQALGC